MAEHKTSNEPERELAPDVEPAPAPDLEHDGAEHEGAEREGRDHDGVVVGAAGVAVRRRGGGASDALGGSAIGDDITETLRRRSGGGSPLPAGLASSYGAAYGADLSGVRVHDDGEAHSIARSVQSVAFTHGQDVYFSRGAYSPGGGGDHTLAHELAHVAQSKTGRHGGGAGTIGRADDPAEADADRMAGSALGGLRRMGGGAVDSAPTFSPTLGAVRRLKDGEEKDLEGTEVDHQEVLDEAVGGAGAMFDDEEKRGERRGKDGGGLTDEVVGGVGTMFADEEKRGERRGKGGGGLTDEVVGGVGTMFADEEKRGQRRGKKGGGGLTGDSVDGVGKLMGDEEKRSERRERRRKGGGGLTDEAVGGTGGMFADEEKRGQRRGKKGGGGLTDDSVDGVGKLMGDEEKRAERRGRKKRGGLSLRNAEDVKDLFEHAPWLTDVLANPQTPKNYVPNGVKYYELDGSGQYVEWGTSSGGVEALERVDDVWSSVDEAGQTLYVKTAEVTEDPSVTHVREDAPVFPLDAKGKPIPPKPDDVKQAGLGDCYLEAALSSLAATSPGQIIDMIKDYGDTASVRLFDVKREKVKGDPSGGDFVHPNTPATFTPKYVRVEKSRVRQGGQLQYDTGALWVGIIEKAYAAGQFGGGEAETENARQPGQSANYGAIEGGLARYAWEVLLGRPSVVFAVTQGGEQDAGNRADLPWSVGELNEYQKNAKKIFGSSYSGLSSYQIFEQSKKKTDLWVKWLKSRGQAAIFKMFVDLEGEKAGGYEHGTIRLEDFELIFADNALPADLATPMLTHLEGLYPGKRGSGKYTRDQLRLWHQIQKALNEKVLVGLDSHEKVGRTSSGVGASGGESKTKGLAGGHAYSVLGTEVVGDLKFVKVRNPWGQYSRDYDVSAVGGKTKLAPKANDGGDGQSMLDLTDVTKRFRLINFS